MASFYEDDEDPADVRATFDRGPHGVTGSSGGARLMCGNGFADGGFVESHKDCRAALDAAQDEIEKLISELAEKRIQIEVLEARPPLVRVVDIRDEGSCVVAEGSHWHVDGGGA